ncbi:MULTISPECIES: hypothetical protein [unclassified Shewanella]|uniref:hypothetical protein n=1 Tax=unclassified Shewanella TaxID=196818 RepID=UPI001BC80D30|nr:MULTISPECIES: hypothetical protein [unclassified Shewanella]GIU05171.1 hypothetical protein TUM4444_01090 [Shewanella sp. MBTL60-112-B1]GIU24313.1 hypothetical protein TUM4445_01280 [Shewanella sp. MBTL60-112-B2]
MIKPVHLFLLALPLVVLQGCNTTYQPPQPTSVEANANSLFVEANLYQHTGEYDKEYDLLQQIITAYPNTRAAVVSSLEVGKLTDKVFNGGIKKDSDKYPQSSYQDLLRSLAKALKSKDANYLVYHLSQYANLPDVDVDQDIIETMQSLLDTNDPRVTSIIDNINLLLDNDVQPEFYQAQEKQGAVLYQMHWQDIRGFRLIRANKNYYWQLR